MTNPNEASVHADKLAQRISRNRGAQSLDFNRWIFSQFPVAEGSRVLELCCGTGSQSCIIHRSLKSGGELFLLDASAEALAAVRAKIGEERITYLCCGLDDIDGQDQLAQGSFDLIFCSYGLYYAQNQDRLLRLLTGLLTPGGRMVVVGPYGANNRELFDLLENSGVRLRKAVTFSSGQYMEEIVLPWAETHFSQINIRTTSNVQRWKSVRDLMAYWENTTFYDPQRARDVGLAMDGAFGSEGEFTVTKHIMLIDMKNKKGSAHEK